MFNNLSPEEHERLVILQEELLEAAHACSKILRHGYKSCHPSFPDGFNNREVLEEELGDVRFSMIWLCNNGDIRKNKIHENANIKSKIIRMYLHHSRVDEKTIKDCL